MPETISTTGVVLSLAPRGENQVLVGLLCPDHGWISLLKRLPQNAGRASTNDRPDLFDSAEVTWQAQGRYLQSYLKLKARPGLARPYRTLQEAAEWARLWCKNAPHMPPDADSIALIEQTLDAMAAYPLPQTAHLKALYRLCREQGYAVRENWLASLPDDLQPLAQRCLFTPLEALGIDDEPGGKLLQNLRRWMAAETDFEIPCLSK